MDYLEAIWNFSHQPQPTDRPNGWQGATEAEYTLCKHVADLWCMGLLPTGQWGDRIERQCAGANELLRYHNGDLQATLSTIDHYHHHYCEKECDFHVVGPQSLVGVLPQFMANGPGSPASLGRRTKGKRARGWWSAAELEEARRESLAEDPIDVETFFKS